MAATALNPAQQSAADILRQMLQQWGIPELYNDAMRLIKQGLDENAILIQLQETSAYKQRFSANDARKKAGLPELNPAEYIATETQYRQVLRQFGLPPGFYDSPKDMQQFLAANVSPAELASRATAAQKIWVTGNQDYRDVWKNYYGLTDGDAIASLLDPKTALPLVEQRVTATQIGAAADRQGFSVARGRAEQLAGLGVDESAALTGYSQIGEATPTDQAIAGRFGTTYTLADEENDRLLGLASAKRKRSDLYGKEEALFAERTGTTQAALSRAAAGGY